MKKKTEGTDRDKKIISDYGQANGNISVKTVYADKNSPDIRECVALYQLEMEYGMDAKLQVKNN